MIAYFPMKNSSFALFVRRVFVCVWVCLFVCFCCCFFHVFFRLSRLFMPLLRHEMTCFALVWTVIDEGSTFFFFFLKRESADSNLIPG